MQLTKTESKSYTELSPWANTIYQQKYAENGETWRDTARRVVTNVVEPYFPEYVDELIEAIAARKFMPGGRYLYASGKPTHQVNNCLLLSVEDSREGWASLMHRVTMGLMTGAGIGNVYSKLRPKGALVRGMGGFSTGPLALMEMVNEDGRFIQQGGGRRAALWAGLHWWHADVFDFIVMKDWSDEIKLMKEKDFNARAPMDGTNISVILDDEFFAAYDDPANDMHDWAHKVYWMVVEKMLTTGEPGFSIDTGDNAGESLRNAPVAAKTNVLTPSGYVPVGDIVGVPTPIWTGVQWAKDVVFKETNDRADTVAVHMTGSRVIEADPAHEFLVERYKGAGSRRKMIRIDRVPAQDLTFGDVLHVSMPELPERDFDSLDYTMGWIYGDGSFTKNGSAELTLCSDESKACLPWISGYRTINESDGRGYTRLYFDKNFGTNRNKEGVPGWCVTPSFIAGLFDADGNWESTQKRVRLASKHEGFLHDIRRGLEMLGIMSHVSKAGVSTYGKSQGYQLVIASEFQQVFAELIPTKRLNIDLDGYVSYRPSTIKVVRVEDAGIQPVYCADVKVAEHSFMAEGVIVSNCTELTSRDDNDICNLGSINLAQVSTKEEFARLVKLGTAFLLSGTLYSMVPYEAVADTRTKNRRLGLGLMGIYEWLVRRGYTYNPNDELAEWLDEYAKSTGIAAELSSRLGISHPVKTRAIAPTGSIGILAETTTGIEPLFAAAYKRRYLKGQDWHYQYVIDATAQRLLDNGVSADKLETAYDLADIPERRIAFQAWMQQWVDHGISSTLNLPAFEKQTFSEQDFGNMLYKYLPSLRGVTVYPDGARGGQPLNVVNINEAYGVEGVEFEEFGSERACISGVCGI